MPKPYRIVLDTNVVICALRSVRGASNALLNRLDDPRIETHVSNALLFEYEELLRREQATLGLAEADLAALLDGFCAGGVRHFVHFTWRPLANDPDDDFLADLAIAARADFVVTHNLRDLSPLREFGISVVTPGQFLGILKGKHE